MSWIRSSEGAILGALLVITLVAVGTAAAYSISGNAPQEAEVGSTITVNATIENPFGSEDGPEAWTVVGETGLNDANWRIETENIGAENGLKVGSGSQISKRVSAANGTNTIVVSVTGTVPEANQYSFENQANVTALTVKQEISGSIQQSDSWTVKKFTTESKNARQAINAAIDAGARNAGEEAQNALSNAIAFYNSGNFEKAIESANKAERLAKQQSGGGPSMLLIGGAVVLLLIVVVGGVAYVYQSNKSAGHKLQ